MFGRLRKRATQDPAGAHPVAAWYSSTPPLTPEGNPGNALTAGWKGIPALLPSQQIGAYNGVMRSRYPAMPKGAMRSSVVEGLSSRLYYPTVRPAAQAAPQSVQRKPVNLPGGQRYGQTFTGPLGPVNVQQLQSYVTAAQVRQSGAAIAPWAQPLTD